jgi:2-keto-4-pentenoate hydratase/2-oxohepta-3-ene-1,7-dioic acid hydratase in catechol pathway
MPLELIEDPKKFPDKPEIGTVVLPVKGRDLHVRISMPQIICLGKNYAEHAKELGTAPPEEPLLFMKPASSLRENGQPIIHPGRSIGRMDHEVELAVIIGKSAWKVPATDAFSVIFGYSVINDVTARDLQGILKSNGHPWFLAKGFATFCPLGPVVVPKKELDPSHLALECRVNDTVRQQGNTRDLIHPVPKLIEFISARIPLLPGDIIATGTPAGIGPLRPGDTVLCRIEGIGDLVNPVEGDFGKGAKPNK